MNVFNKMIAGTKLKKPCITVPIMPNNYEETLTTLKGLSAFDIDIIEWRIDYFEKIDSNNLRLITDLIKKEIDNDILLLVTLRSTNQGGEFSGSKDEYFSLLDLIMDCEHVDGIDVEFQYASKALISKINSKKKFTICSDHNFEKTGSFAELELQTNKMAELKSDIVKLATMANSQSDIVQLMLVGLLPKDYGFVAISMGDLGDIIRLGTRFINNDLLFLYYKTPSAPGQVSIEEYYQLNPIETNRSTTMYRKYK